MRYVWLMLLLVTMSACGSMVSTYSVGPNGSANVPSPAAGSYFLPKHLLKVAVTRTGQSSSLRVETVAVRDEHYHLQLGLNLSATSDDTVEVKFKEGLLWKIEAVADDKTSDIILEAFKATANLREQKLKDETATALFFFDPFDPADARRAARQIAAYSPGSCVSVELFDGAWSPGCAHDGSVSAFEPSAGPPPVLAPGIYYRRFVDHKVLIFNGKRVVDSTVVRMGNHSPILRVDVDRTLFVKRETSLEFTDGELTSVKVVKPSEALAVVKLPLSIVTASLAAVKQGLIESAAVEAARVGLAQAETNRINAEAALLKVQASLGGPSPGGDSGRTFVLPELAPGAARDIGLAP